jgi:HSP20 family protein
MTLLFERFAPLFEMSREMDRLLANGTRQLGTYMPPADVIGSEEHVTVTMDLPGFTSSDIDVELVDDVLTVRGERAFPYGDAKREGRSWQRLERGFGTFERVLRVPHGLDPDAIEASLVDGVLTLHIPMPESRKPRKVAIGGGITQPAIESSPTEKGKVEERELAGATA